MAGLPSGGATAQERELATLIVQALNLEDVDADALAPETPLFLIEDGGLGLDSIDALEIALAINEHYGVEIRVGEEGSDEEALRAIFRCVRSLAAHIASERAAG
jgi:acyl carrier protein